MNWTRIAAVAAFVVATAAQTPTRATTMVPFSDEDLSLLADAVVVARVEDVKAVRDGRGMIHTETTLDIEQSWKGALKANSYVTVRSLGGTHNGVRALVSSTSIFLKGERTLLYLENDKKGGWRVLGMTQGKYTVLPGAEGIEVATKLPLRFQHSGLDIAHESLKGLIKPNTSAKKLGERRFLLERTIADHAAKGGGDPWKLDKYQGIGR